MKNRNLTYITNPFDVHAKILAFEKVPGPTISDLTITDVTV